MRRSTPFELLQSQRFRTQARIQFEQGEALVKKYAFRFIKSAKISQKTRRRRAKWI